VLVLLIGAAVALIIALVGGSHGDANSANPTTQTRAAVPVIIPIGRVTAFDPQGTGQPGENNAQVALTSDDNPATAWHTEGYNARDFGTKTGVGLIIQLAHPTPLQSLDVSSPTHGWAAQVFVSDSSPTQAPTASPTASLTNISGDAHFKLSSSVGSTIVLWITNLGSGAAGSRYSVTISELKVRGGA
jgi:putative peptidoglycan lipid II flippase